MSDGMTPLVAVVQRGLRIHTKDMAGQETLVASAPDPDQANWVGWSLSEYHEVPFQVEEAGPGDMTETAVNITGPVDDPMMLKILQALGPDMPITHITETERRSVAQEVLSDRLLVAQTLNRMTSEAKGPAETDLQRKPPFRVADGS